MSENNRNGESSGLKRSRSQEDDSIPIAKKIHSLHLRHSDEECDADFSEGADGSEPRAAMSMNDFGADEAASADPSHFHTAPNWTPHPLHHQPPPPALLYPVSPAYSAGQPYNSGPIPAMLPAAGVHPLLAEVTEPYNPDLGPTDNPNYYNINGMLYYAHMEKLHRLNPSGGHHFLL